MNRGVALAPRREKARGGEGWVSTAVAAEWFETYLGGADALLETTDTRLECSSPVGNGEGRPLAHPSPILVPPSLSPTAYGGPLCSSSKPSLGRRSGEDDPVELEETQILENDAPLLG
ncbi:hypothetical protein KM043_006211 [Ampulex compressa]|nr:hypothetical protein KM043_006211 [Ampulex compressa]